MHRDSWVVAGLAVVELGTLWGALAYARRRRGDEVQIVAVETALTERYKLNGPITNPTEQRDWDNRIRDASEGRNSVYFDRWGNPSVLVKLDAKTLKEFDSSWPDRLHQAFIVNNVLKPTIYVAKFLGVRVTTPTGYGVISLRGVDPEACVTFDAALSACRGSGLSLCTNAIYAYLALLCRKRGFMPRGNTSYGKSSDNPSEAGVVSYTYESGGVIYAGRTLTGSGPSSWFHDGTQFGVADLCGNVWEWVAGLRLIDGEINVLPDNDAADANADLSRTSAAWKAILQDGSLVAPGTAGTLKYDSPNPMTNDGATQSQGAPILRTSILNGPDPAWGWGDGYYDYNYGIFENITADSGVTVPAILRQLCIFPPGVGLGSDVCWVRNYGERVALRGGSWGAGASAGVFALALDGPRSYSHRSIGFRAAFIPA